MLPYKSLGVCKSDFMYQFLLWKNVSQISYKTLMRKNENNKNNNIPRDNENTSKRWTQKRYNKKQKLQNLLIEMR